jgi:hypothetical protein
MQDPSTTTTEEESIVKKAKTIIEQSISKEQLKTAWNFVDLFTKNDDRKKQIRDELMGLWLEKDKLLFQELN